MNSIKITTSQNIELEYELASLGERIVGWLVDWLIILAYAMIASTIFFTTFVGNNNWIAFIFIIPIVFYDLASEVFLNGQSVGKRVMHLKVISLDGNQPTLGQYLIRWVFRFVDFTITNCLGALICVAVSERKQRIGDIVAGTTIIKTITRVAFNQTIHVPTQKVDYTISFPEVGNLADLDMQLVKEVIINVNTTGNSMLAYQAAEKIKQTLQIESSLEPMNFLQLLLSDYNYVTSKV